MSFSSNRLKSKKTIDLLFSKGKQIKVPGLSLVYIKQTNKNLSGLRVGFSVGKKMQPLAVSRNKTKRLLRECFRFCVKEGFSTKKHPYNLMFVCFEKSPPPFDELCDKIKSLLLSFSESVEND